YALSLASLIVVFGDLGVSKIITRDLAKKDTTPEKLSSTFWPHTIFLTAILFVSIILLLLFGQSEVLWPFVFASVFTVANLLGDYWFGLFRAYEQMKLEAVLKAIQAIIALLLGGLLLWKYSTDTSLAIAYALGALVSTVWAAIKFKEKFVFSASSIVVWKDLIKRSWPVGAITIFSYVYNQIDSVMMGWWGMFSEVGMYNAAYRVVAVSL